MMKHKEPKTNINVNIKYQIYSLKNIKMDPTQNHTNISQRCLLEIVGSFTLRRKVFHLHKKLKKKRIRDNFR